MKRGLDNIIGVIGLFASAAICLFDIAGIALAGPRVMPFIRTPLALIVEIALYLILPHDGSDGQGLALAIYFVLYAALFAVFGWALWQRTSHRVQRQAWRDTCLLLVLVTIALLTGVGADAQLPIVTAAVFGFVLPPHGARLWLASQMAMYTIIQTPYLIGVPGVLQPPLDSPGTILSIGLQMTWMIVAFGIGYLAAIERRGRFKLAAANAQLQATQHLLADSLRASERVRISRNLHDAIGHHLTALNLHLELGLRQSGEAAQSSFRLSRQVAQGLMAEVRSIVGSEREESNICLRQALELLCAGIPAPRVDLHYDDAIEIGDPGLAHVLFRCIQEGITNTIRHANAANMLIAFRKLEGAIAIDISDDGRGKNSKKEGNGLLGMRERIDEIGGSFETGNRPAGGFSINIVVPFRSGFEGAPT